MSRRFVCTLAAVGLLLGLATAAAAPQVATLRGATELDQQGKPPPMAQVDNRDIRRGRDYPMQPPVIPHKIDNYQVDLKVNKCMSCHSRQQTARSQAPMVSVTHYMDRDGNFLASVSPRRYFCSQCHVTQDMVQPAVESDFIDMDDLTADSAAQTQSGAE